MRIVGITGTRDGATVDQRFGLMALFARLEPNELHHGDCVGADKQAHQLYRWLYGAQSRVIGHPPIQSQYRAFCKFDELRPEKDYLARNRDIVDECDVLIAIPKTEVKERSGTWATINYARETGMHVEIIMPDGHVE